MSKPTPGPWIIQDDNENENSAIVVDSPTESNIIAGPCPRTNDQGMANLRLIAAAPDLLTALKEVASMVEAYHEVPPTRANQVRAAIKKAEGEQ